MNPGFWGGKRVFVTGHTGFKGAWLALWMHHLGAEVGGLALEPQSEPSLASLLEISAFTDSRIGDIRDPALTLDAVRHFAPEIVFHLAAQPLVGASFDSPAATFATNVMGTVHLLEAVRNTPSVRATVVVTSDKCYHNTGSSSAYLEDAPLGGNDPYSSSKACAELVTAAYRRSFFEGRGSLIASARAGNVIGGGDWSADRLIPDLVRALLSGRTPLLRRPTAVRPWQHVLDALSGYLELAQALCERGPEFAQAWNFGPAETTALTVAQLTDAFLGSWGAAVGWERVAEPGYHEEHTLRVDSTKARARLGWQPRLDPAAAADLTARWYRAWHDGASPRALSLAQIEDYSARTRPLSEIGHE